MVRKSAVDKNGLTKGAWSEEEDNKLRAYVLRYGHWNWRQLPKFAGLARCGKSCRLRWMNYLRPGLKRGSYSKEEEEMIIKLQQELGNKWSVIAAKLPGRTDNEIKNFWHTHLKKPKKQDPKSTEKTSGTSKNMHVMDQKEQDSSIFVSESTDQQMELAADVPAADAFVEQISSSYNYSSIFGGAEDSFSSEESFPKFFESFWTEPFSSSASYSPISSSTSHNSTVPGLEDWVTETGISLDESFVKSFESFFTKPIFSEASNGIISPSTSYDSTVTNSEESSTNAFCSFWTEPIFSSAPNSQISASTSYDSTVTISEESSTNAFCSFWTEPIFSNAPNSQISASTSYDSTVTNSEESSTNAFCSFWTEPIFSNAPNSQILPSTSCNITTISNSQEASTEAFGSFCSEPFSLDTSYNPSIHQLPPMEKVVPFTSDFEYDVNLFNQF